MESLKIGRVSATEKVPTSCDEFIFWLEDKQKVSPFDIIKVENNIAQTNSITYGVIQDIFHITDSPGHLSNYISSDFGDVNSEGLTQKLGLSYAKASVIHNDKENYMPVRDGAPVYPADANDIKKALGLDIIPTEKAIPAGVLHSSTGVNVTINYSSDFLVGPEGAHINISGISGLATKTSYAMFLLQAIQQKVDDVATIILNVKGDDLLRLHEPNRKFQTPEAESTWRQSWEETGLKCEPFANVQYFYPYKKSSAFPYSLTSLNNESLVTQYSDAIASNFIYTYEHDSCKLDLLFSNIDDPNFTIESILNFIADSPDFDSLNWETFKDRLGDYTNKETRKHIGNKDIPIQSWWKFKRLISNSINNDIFQKTISNDPERRQVHLSDKIQQIKGGDTFVVDIAKLDEQLQCLVFGDIIKAVYGLKHGEIERENIPRRVVIFVDELNKYAPSTSPKGSPILNYLLEITERGRSEGVILFSAEQFKSAVHDRVKGNCSTHVYGRTNAIEISKPDYRYIPNVFSNMLTRISKGDLIIQHPIFKTLLKIRFPFPSYRQGV
jgi:DNA helicase HerA-like ATPase